MNAFGFKSYICLFLSISLIDLSFQTCQAFNFSILLPKRKYIFKRIFNSEKVPVAGEFILRKKDANGRPGEKIRFLVPLTTANTQFSLKANNPVRINDVMYSTKITPLNGGKDCRFDFEQIGIIPFVPPTKKPTRNPVKKQIPIKHHHKTLKSAHLSPSKLVPPSFFGTPQNPKAHPLYPSGLVPLPAPSSS